MTISKRLRIKEITTGLNAEKSGLAIGDIILTYDGKPMLTSGHLTQASQEVTSDSVEIEFSRKGVLLRTCMPKGRMGLYVEEFPFDETELQKEQELAKKLECLATPTLQAALELHKGESISINLLEPTKFEYLTLRHAGIDHFIVSLNEMLHRIPYTQVLNTAENFRSGALVVTINHLVIYKGAVGFGMSIPLDM